jgi:raffinose/stachyose/melibiose transport system permease protein
MKPSRKEVFINHMNRILLKFSAFFYLMIVIIISIGPFLWVFASSLRTNKEILSSDFSFSAGIAFRNYERAFDMAPITQYYFNSIVVAVLSTILNIIITAMAAYVLSRFQFRGRDSLRLMLSFGLLIPAAALLIPLYLSIRAIGLYDNMWGLILTYAGFGIPISLYIMISYMMTIPKELEESAYMDGSGFMKTFLQIIIPLVTPALATATVLQFLLSWNEFQIALLLTSSHTTRTLPIALLYFKTALASDLGAMMAAITLVALPSILVFVALQKQVVAGLVTGAVKG